MTPGLAFRTDLAQIFTEAPVPRKYLSDSIWECACSFFKPHIPVWEDSSAGTCSVVHVVIGPPDTTFPVPFAVAEVSSG